MQQRICPASRLTGSITLPGDKSISHRYAMIASLKQIPVLAQKKNRRLHESSK